MTLSARGSAPAFVLRVVFDGAASIDVR